MSLAEASGIYGVEAVIAAKTGSTVALAAAKTGVSAGFAMESAGVGGAKLGGAALTASTNVAEGSLVAAKAGMSLADKVIATKIVADVAGAVWGPSPQEEWEAKALAEAKFHGPYYGMEADGSTLFAAEAPAPPGPDQPAPAQPGPAAPAPASTTPEQQQLLAGREKKESLFPSARSVPTAGQTTGPGPMQQQFPIPSNVAAPQAGVRYV